MKNNKLVSILAILFIVSHFLVIFLIVLFKIIGWYGDEELKLSLPIILPLFGSFTSIIIKYILANQNKRKISTRKKSFLFSFVCIFFPIVFLGYMILILLNQAYHPQTIENFSMFLGLGETVFGVYIGLLLKSLFNIEL